VIARTIAEAAAPFVPQPTIVVNRPGAGGALAAEQVARGHVMPMWEPSPPQPAPTVTRSNRIPAAAALERRRQPRTPKAKTLKGTARHFADPFADVDEGANCLRCGYLVEPARERRGLLTCSSCG
jgi:hypothetical protein